MATLVFTPQGIICLKTPLSDEEKLTIKIMIAHGESKDEIEDWLLKRDFIVLNN